MSHVVHLTPQDIKDQWEILAPMFYSAMEERGTFDTYNITDLLKDFLDRKTDCWTIVKDNKTVAALATYLVHYKTMKAMKIGEFGGLEGYSELWHKHLKQIEDYAKECGVKRFIIEGRKAWERVFVDDGYEFRNIVLIKDL